MPIFQDDFEGRHRRPRRLLSARATPVEEPSLRLRRLSEESLPTELCEGPVSDSPGRACTPRPDDDTATSCRAELIERLKRGESPTWIPNRHLESMCQVCDTSPGSLRTSPDPPHLLPLVQITPDKVDGRTRSPVEDRAQDGLAIERPRSALHSGDFTNSQEEQQRRSVRDRERLGPESPWTSTSPPRDFAPFRFETKIAFPGDAGNFRSVTASPLSSSLTSTFAYHPPTSPLVQSESNDEVGFVTDCPGGVDLSSSREFGRRLQALDNSIALTPFASPSPRPAAGGCRIPPARREPYQAHQPRRSLTSTPSLALPGTSPHQPPGLFRPRRPSLGADLPPLQHASMVGSYEESILRGRMSTTPSKPFDFLAQIGVLGRGKCKSSLRCPAHVTLPFPAVYYSYSSTSHSRSASNDGPSPYVGQIDLENGLPNVDEEARLKRKAHGRYLMDRGSVDSHDDDLRTRTRMPDLDPDPDPDQRPRPACRPKRRACPARAPPGGSYRIPEKGQVQIVIKNQNKTAVKLFLMPYDLTGMEPGTKTFVRQRSYSAGPVIDSVPNPSETDAQSRPMLRYLVHLHICCPSKGRFYLYKSIRVVFANRVPEGKERLRNETTWPEPRFTPYKPIRLMHPPLAAASSGPGAILAADQAFRRRSFGLSLGAASSSSFSSSSRRALDMPDGFDASGAGNTRPVDPLPFRLPCQDDAPRDGDDAADSAGGLWSVDSLETTTSRPPLTSRLPTRGSANMAMRATSSGISSSSSSASSSSSYEKLNKGDPGYGGNAFFTHHHHQHHHHHHLAASNNAPTGSTAGLLSQRLRSIGINKPPPPTSAEDLA
ncbi:hypothetical protein E4U41_000191 [Claviceps citrina]|nr:hypothetical protein E4U41_000191 [Claviceps citrina]